MPGETKSVSDQTEGPAEAPKVLRTGTVDWRLSVRTETGTVATDTEQIKRYEATRDKGVRDDMDIARKKARVHNLLLDICKKLEYDVENLAPKFSPKSYESETLVFTVDLDSRDMNVGFEAEFLALAGKYEFEPMVVHEPHSESRYKLTDTDGKMILLVSGQA